jgi:phosphoglycerate kinase
VFWNGPLGLAEDPRFAGGTKEVLAALGSIPGYHVAAGGDSGRVAQDLGVTGGFQFVSTGGGAALEFVQGLELPGLAVLPNA